MAHVNEQNATPYIQCVANKAKCYKKTCRPSCHRCYTKKGGCSLAQGRRTKEDEDNVGLAAGCQEWMEEFLEGLCKGDCRAELNQILAGGPKLIYYNK